MDEVLSWLTPLEAVDKLDMRSYLGRWVQVAALPTWFAPHHVGVVTAEYTLQQLAGGEQRIRVVNTETVGTRVRSISGELMVAPDCRHEGDVCGRFEVSFTANTDFPVVPPVPAPYWVIQYEPGVYAVVSEPWRRTLWILSRDGSLSAANWARIHATLRKQGFTARKIAALEWRQDQMVEPVVSIAH